MRPVTVSSSLSMRVPDTSWRVAMITSSLGWRRMAACDVCTAAVSVDMVGACLWGISTKIAECRRKTEFALANPECDQQSCCEAAFYEHAGDSCAIVWGPFAQPDDRLSPDRLRRP